jgi:hypothetical protein
MLQHRTGRALAWGAALALSLTGVAQAQRSGTTRQTTLPTGTVLRAELNDTLSSTDSRPGDSFTATIRSDRDGSGLPEGTEVIGRVTAVRRASDRQPATVDVDFQSLRLPNGRSYPIDASLTSLDSSSVRRTSDGRLESRSGSSSKDRTKFIGYGAGAGALIGALSGGDLLMSALLGAAAGYLYGELNKDKESRGRYSEVNLKSGTEFGVRLDRQLALATPYNQYGRYDDRSTRNDDRYRRSDERSTPYDRRAGSFERYGNGDIRVLVNDRDVRFGDEKPYMSAGRVMVPVEPVLDTAGYRYRYDTRNREITVYGERGDSRLALGTYDAWIDGRRVRLEAPAQDVRGTLFVPVQFLEEATDIRSDWDATGRTLRLTTRYRASLPEYQNGYRVRPR